MKIRGVPITMNGYNASKVRTNKLFAASQLGHQFNRFYLPDSMKPFIGGAPDATNNFIVDDNRSVVTPQPVMKIDNVDFYLSIKGIGSTTSPFSRQPITKTEVCGLLKNPELRQKITTNTETILPRYLTGELWSRGSPYGCQGLQYAAIAMRASEMANTPTSIHGFRIAPIVNIVHFPVDLQNEITKIFWYRKFKEEMVQEIRLVPSNVRIYFHSDYTVGDDTCAVFNLFNLDTNEKALAFMTNFLKSGMAVLTLFARTLKDNKNGTFSGLDFYDVWLDKDAVIAPDGTIYWVDLEGLEWITVWDKGQNGLEEKMEYQIYRSLYELMYAYEQIEHERAKRFGNVLDRKIQFEYLLEKALQDDEILKLEKSSNSLELVIGNVLGRKDLVKKFTLIDW